MSTPKTRLDFRPPFTDMGYAINDLAELPGIAQTVIENAIRETPPSYIHTGCRIPEGYVLTLLTEDQFSNVHFIIGRVRETAQKARESLIAVEDLIAEDDR